MPISKEPVHVDNSTVVVSKADTKTSKANRTIVQFLVALAASGALVAAWEAIVANGAIDPVYVGVVTPVILYTVTWLQNYAEERGIVIPGLTKPASEEVVIESVQSDSPDVPSAP